MMATESNESISGMSYQYRPLGDGEIRLIDLDPGYDQAPLHCRIRHVRLESNWTLDREVDDFWDHLGDVEDEDEKREGPWYEAISYAWDKPTLERMIVVDSQYHQPITASLANALQHLRSITEVRTPWADAICISQLDLSEKATQVSMMATTYALACRIVVWLGVSESLDNHAFTWIRRSREDQEHRCQEHD